MTHEISDAAASRDRHNLRRGGGEVGPNGPSAHLKKVMASSALRGDQGALFEGGQNGQLELGDASSDSVPRGINRRPLEADGESL